MAGRRLLASLAAVVALMSLPVPAIADTAAPPATGPLGGLWYAIGDSPTDAEIATAASRYAVVILNSWDAPAMRRLKSLNPAVRVLVYKDFSSTRSYAAPGDRIPAGVDYTTAVRQHPSWFATDTRGARIEWNGYPGHWQMAVWDPSYQQAWTENVTAEVVADGWDGVFADNDFAHLSFYSGALLAGTQDRDQADLRIRTGLDQLVTRAGSALAARGKILVPNVSEARLFPGRWALHSRFGGAMEENFAYWPGQVVGVAQGWNEQTSQLAQTTGMALLITASADPRVQRYGFASAAVRAGGATAWMGATTTTYTAADWSPLQQLHLGTATGPPVMSTSGVWSRAFTGGWAAVNPTDRAQHVTPPAGLRPAAGSTTPAGSIAAVDAVLFVR